MASQRVRRPEGPQDWEAQRAVIIDLYITKGLELEDLMNTMEREHFFKATKKQYKTHFTNWDLRKNVRPSEYNAIIKKKRKREEEGKDSAFRLRGALVNDSKIVRYEKKTKGGNDHEIAEPGTPEDLSCFTPSPVASSSDAPSPVLPQLQSPNLLRSSIVSPSEQTLLVSSLLGLFPQGPGYEMEWRFFAFIEPPVDSVASRLVSLELTIHLQDPETVDDIIKMAPCQRMEHFGSNLLGYRTKHSSLSRHVSCFIECAGERTYCVTRQSALYVLVSLQMAFLIRSLSHFLTRLKPAPTDSGLRKYLFRLSTSVINAPSDVGDVFSGLEVSFTERERQLVVKFSASMTRDLEQKHDPPVRRSKSCESIRSTGSFLSDSVVDWEELLYGYNP